MLSGVKESYLTIITLRGSETTSTRMKTLLIKLPCRLEKGNTWNP